MKIAGIDLPSRDAGQSIAGDHHVERKDQAQKELDAFACGATLTLSQPQSTVRSTPVNTTIPRPIAMPQHLVAEFGIIRFIPKIIINIISM